MLPQTGPQPIPDTAHLEEELILYAQELYTLYQEEKKEREALAEEKLVLEYKLRELAALNSLFQKHLERQQQQEDALSSLTKGLRRMLAHPQGKLRPQIEALLAAAEATLAASPQ